MQEEAVFEGYDSELKKYFYDKENDYINLPIEKRSFKVYYGEKLMVFLPFIINKAEHKKPKCKYDKSIMKCTIGNYFYVFL